MQRVTWLAIGVLGALPEPEIRSASDNRVCWGCSAATGPRRYPCPHAWEMEGQTWGRRGEGEEGRAPGEKRLVTSQWLIYIFFFFYMKHTCCDQEALLISWWHLARLFSWIYKKKKKKHFPLGRWHLVWLTQQQGCVACYSWYTHNKQTWLYGNNVSGLLRTENSSRSLKVFPLRP